MLNTLQFSSLPCLQSSVFIPSIRWFYSFRYPNLLKWYEAMDKRESYLGIKSDYVSSQFFCFYVNFRFFLLIWEFCIFFELSFSLFFLTFSLSLSLYVYIFFSLFVSFLLFFFVSFFFSLLLLFFCFLPSFPLYFLLCFLLTLLLSFQYTHCHDLPPQIGGCQFSSESQPYKLEIGERRILADRWWKIVVFNMIALSYMER